MRILRYLLIGLIGFVLMWASCFVLVSAAEARVPTITVHPHQRFQTIHGFGGAMTDSSAWLLWNELSPSQRTKAFDELAKVVSDVRVAIGPSDFTHDGQPYVWSLAHDQAYILPALQAMKQRREGINFHAAAWSALPAEKANDAFDNVNYAGTLIDPQGYANLVVSFLKAYQHEGIPLSSVTTGNEFGTPTEYPGTTVYDPVGFVLDTLIPTLRTNGLSTKVYDLDGSGFTYELSWLGNPSYRSAIAGTAAHCYAGLGQLSEIHAENPSGDIMETECSPGIVNYSPAETVIASLRNWASTVDLWNLALDAQGGPKQDAPGCTGCSGFLTVNESTHSFQLNRNYYQMLAASAIKPGAVRIGSTRLVQDYFSNSSVNYGVTAGLDDVAAQNPDGSIVLLAYNNSGHRITFRIQRHGVHQIDPHQTKSFTW